MITRRTRRKLNNALRAVLRHARRLAQNPNLTAERVVAVFLCLAMLMTAFPAETFAVEWKTVTDKNSGQQATVMPEFRQNSDGNYYYCLEVSSGTRLNGGYADNVLYFAVHSTDINGVKRTAIVMPGVDAVSLGNELAYDIANQKSREQLVSEAFGASVHDLRDQRALGSVTSDRILFESPEKIDTVDSIQIFGKNTPSASVWPCQGMRIYEVHRINGLYMYGWYSDKSFVDFDGTVVAEAIMASGGGNFTWNTTGGTFNVNRYETGKPKEIELVNLKDKEQFESETRKTTHLGLETRSAKDSPVVIRMDLADQGGAGFDSLALYYSEGSKPYVADLKLPEAAALTIRYEDHFGDQRDVTLPLIINALGSAMEVLGSDIRVAGFAQQGDSLAIPALFPNFRRVVNARVVLGAHEAISGCGLILASDMADDPKYQTRAALSDTDSVAYQCIAVYSDVKVMVGLDGAVIRYTYEAGENNPVSYSSATSIDGLSLVTGQTNSITFNDYYNRLVLDAEEYQDRYLVTLSTDNVANSGTTDDLQIQFKYINLKDKESRSPLYHVNTYIDAFYGNWAGSTEDFAYNWTMRDGGTAQFIVPLSDVKEFTGVGFKLEGQDEWQFSGVRIDGVKKVSKRSVDWVELKSSETKRDGTPRFESHVYITRDVEIANKPDKPLFEMGKVYYENDKQRPTGGSDDWIPGTLVQDDDTTSEFNGQGEIIDKQDEIDWGSILHYMTYEQARQDLKFTKQRTNYKVSVTVGGSKVNADDDDCGSKNLFYFQLIFENGKSGCIQANQQITGDGFRTGTITEFYIPCTQDYGDLTAIRVIPDDQDGNSDIYDKLKIQSIEVEKMTDDFICPTWAARSADKDGLGWVGIDYRDPGEVSTNKGAEGRSISEIATTYQITESSYNAKFLVSIKTGPYNVVPRPGENGEVVYRQDPTFYGGMTMTYSYFDRNGNIQNVNTPIDIVKLMYDYAARTPYYQRQTDEAEENYVVDYAVSDTAYNFRAGKTDNFYITVKDISQFVEMSLQLRSDVITHWNVSSIMIYLVNGQGVRYINGQGEYDYRYSSGKDPTLVAEWTRDEGLTADLGIYRKKQNTGIQEIAHLQLDCDPINLNPDAAGWATLISREPKSKDDTFNLFIYPQQSGDNVTDPDTYSLKAAVQYKNSLTLKPVQTSAGTLRKAYDENDDLYCMYAVGLDGQNMASLDGVIVDTNSLVPIQAPITRGVLQVIRGGVLMESYNLTGVPNADLGGMMIINNNPAESHKQKIYLQMSRDTKTQKIEAETKDVAVALHFRGDDPAAQELRSKYIYLSDAGYKTIAGGQIYELDMDLGDLSAITGINVVGIGAIDATIERASAVELDIDGNVYNTFSSDRTYALSGRAGRMESQGKVVPLTLELTTAPDESTVSSGTTGPIRMTIGFYDSYGKLTQETYENIRPYIVEGSGFKSDDTDKLKILVPDLAELRWVEFEPLKAAGTSGMASWKLQSLTVSTGYDGREVSRTLNQMILEGEPLHISLSDILLYGTVKVGEGEEAENYSVNSGGTSSVLLESGITATINNKIYGTYDGITGTIENYDPSSGAVAKARLNARYGYDMDYLRSIYEEAKADAESETQAKNVVEYAKRVVNIAETMLNGDGTFMQYEDQFVFTAPRNYSGKDLYYRITVKSVEMPDVYYTVDVTVEPQSDILSDFIDFWRQEKANAAAAAEAAAAQAAAEAAAQQASQQSSGTEANTTGSGINAPAESNTTGGGISKP